MAMTQNEQTRLEVAEMKAREAQETIDTLFGNKSTNTFMSDIVGSTFKDYPLLPGANIKFQVGKYREFIQARVVKDVLQIMGDSSIIILPGASNTIDIKLRDR